MKIRTIIALIIFIALPQITAAGEDFLGAPVLPNSKTINKEADKLELSTTLSHEEVLSYYRDQLKGEEDIQFRDWNVATYIEDDGSRPWHSITITKDENGAETTVTIAKDSWTWIIGTLILRYIGVFVVLLLLFIGMKVSGGVISGTVKRSETKKAA